jgi:hypothetical protein
MKTDAELYEHYLKVAKVGGKENAHKGLRAVYDAGRRAALEEAIAECQRGKERCAAEMRASMSAGCCAWWRALHSMAKQSPQNLSRTPRIG